MATLAVTNDREPLLCVYLEPWGEDYWIRRGEVIRFRAETKGEVECVTHSQGLSVWIGDASEVLVLDGGGTAVECGYQRPPGWPEERGPGSTHNLI